MRTLVLGGAGFIGSHLVERLLREGHQVRVLDNLSTGKRENLQRVAADVELVVADLRDQAMLTAAARGCDVIFHQAAIVSVQRSVEEPRLTQDVNLGGTLNVLLAAREVGARRVVFASSAAVYGAGGAEPRRESMATFPQSPYGLEKLAGEHYLRMWNELYGLETVALRYFNVFGPRQDPSSPYSGVISIFVDRLKRRVAPTIFGDGEQMRDFVHVSNVVEANYLAGSVPGAQGVFNVASGTATSLNHLFETMRGIAGSSLMPTYAAARSGDIRHSSADISLSRERLGYVPRVALGDGLTQLLADAVDGRRSEERSRPT